jgi:hypothetical protein
MRILVMSEVIDDVEGPCSVELPTNGLSLHAFAKIIL